MKEEKTPDQKQFNRKERGKKKNNTVFQISIASGNRKKKRPHRLILRCEGTPSPIAKKRKKEKKVPA